MRRLTTHIALWAILFAVCPAQAEPRLTSGNIADGTRWQTAYYVRDSGIPGPTLLVTGGIHGNEPSGYRAAEQIRNWPIRRGKLVVIPQANVPGLQANMRHMPDVADELRDLNRNFPSLKAAAEPRGTAASALWQFVQDLRPDWVLDLHEGYEFNISHQPPPGKGKSVGSSVIYQSAPQLDALALQMIAAVNATIDDPDRRFVLLGRGPKETTFARACIEYLDIPGMILETTFKDQPLSLRTRQHRTLVQVVMQHLGMLADDCLDVMVAAESSDQFVHVGLYDGPGTAENSLTALLDADRGTVVHHLGPADLRTEVLRQFDVVLVPSGSSSQQAEALGATQRDALRKFVENGGGFVGIGTGARLCASDHLHSLGLLPAKAASTVDHRAGATIRPVSDQGKPAEVEVEFTPAGLKLLGEMPELATVPYHDGPVFQPLNTEKLGYTILAQYRTEQALESPQQGTTVDGPAIIRAAFGRGRVVAISPPLEAASNLKPVVLSAIRHAARHHAPQAEGVLVAEQKQTTPQRPAQSEEPAAESQRPEAEYEQPMTAQAQPPRQPMARASEPMAHAAEAMAP